MVQRALITPATPGAATPGTPKPGTPKPPTTPATPAQEAVTIEETDEAIDVSLHTHTMGRAVFSAVAQVLYTLRLIQISWHEFWISA